MPRDEYSELLHDGCFDEYSRKSTDLFPVDLRSRLTADGLYPPWLQREMDKVLPPDILERFEDTQELWPCNDPYPHIDLT
jgi:hypothetical protein